MGIDSLIHSTLSLVALRTNHNALDVLLGCGVSQVSPNRSHVQLDFIVKQILNLNLALLLHSEMKLVHVTKVTVHHVTLVSTAQIWE